jgi:glycosidase
MADDASTLNVANEKENPNSLLQLYRKLLALRRNEPALAIGGYRPVPAEGNVLAYLRRYRNRGLLIALNLDDDPGTVQLPLACSYKWLMGTDPSLPPADLSSDQLQLRGNEGVILQMDC